MYDTHELLIYNDGFDAGIYTVLQAWRYVQEGEWNFEDFDMFLARQQ